MNGNTMRTAGGTLATLALAALLSGCGHGGGGSGGGDAAATHGKAAHDDATTHGAEGKGAPVAAGATAAEIRAQLSERRLALETSIHEGRLNEVHDRAFAVRDLVIALHEKAGVAPGTTHEQIDAKLAELKASAGKLDEYGDAGNLSGAESEFVKFNAVVSAIDAATPQ